MSFYNKATSKIRLIKMSEFKSPKEVSIEEIPTNWESFPLNTNDEWVKVILPKTEEAVSCLYRVKKKSTFLPHKHKVDEILTVINENGEIEVITTNGTVILKYGESYLIPAGVTHGCVIKEGTKLSCMWVGNFEGAWDAVFPSNKI